MANTPAMPLAGIGAPTAPVPYTADRVIPNRINPAFGIPVNGIIPGVGPMENAFYNPELQYVNTLEIAFLTPNQTVDWYGAAIPGLMNLQNNSGVQG